MAERDETDYEEPVRNRRLTAMSQSGSDTGANSGEPAEIPSLGRFPVPLASRPWSFLIVTLAFLSIISSISVLDSIQNDRSEMARNLARIDRLHQYHKAALELHRTLVARPEVAKELREQALKTYRQTLAALAASTRATGHVAVRMERVEEILAPLAARRTLPGTAPAEDRINVEIQAAVDDVWRNQDEVSAKLEERWRYLNLLALVSCMLTLFPPPAAHVPARHPGAGEGPDRHCRKRGPLPRIGRKRPGRRLRTSAEGRILSANPRWFGCSGTPRNRIQECRCRAGPLRASGRPSWVGRASQPDRNAAQYRTGVAAPGRNHRHRSGELPARAGRPRQRSVLRRNPHRHHGPQAGGTRAGGLHPASGGGQPPACRAVGGAEAGARHGAGSVEAEVGIPGQHEPRDPDPDERGHRHERPAAGNRAYPRAARICRGGAPFGRIPAGHPERHSGLLQDRGRLHDAGVDRVRSADDSGERD